MSLANNQLRSYADVHKSVQSKASPESVPFGSAAYPYALLTLPEQACWLLDELYLYLDMGKPYLWYQHFVEGVADERGISDMRPVIRAIIRLAGDDFLACQMRIDYILKPKQLSFTNDIALSLWRTMREEFEALRAHVVSHWPDDLDCFSLSPVPPSTPVRKRLTPEAGTCWFPTLSIDAALFVSPEGVVQVTEAGLDGLISYLWMEGVGDADLERVISRLTSLNDYSELYSALEQIVPISDSNQKNSIQNQQPVAKPTWWKDWSVPGIITLAENQVEEALAYFAAQGFFVVDNRVLPEYAPSVGEATISALRQSPDIVLFMGNAVTEADVPRLQMVIVLSAPRFVFVGEPAVPVN